MVQRAGFRIAACLLVGGLAPFPAQADLGGDVAAVRADSVRMRARLASVDRGAYARHDLTRDTGGTVREFTNARGQVFAVSWSGPGKPDLRALLGRHFAALQGSTGPTAAVGHRILGLRRPAIVAEPDLQIQTGGHMGWFYGAALIPSLAPSGFDRTTLTVQP
ncbi:DUF2844 domain-containing protein [Sphingomonas sp. RB3P16]|uniref:DUF2844 domain-containing protein n=1 Tax=Parasphingomonas frigoris TaxID=3096163 RepID=UPI002FCA26D1